MTGAPGRGRPVNERKLAGLPSGLERAVQLARERKAVEVAVLDLRELSSATDFFLIASGRSDVQVRAIAEHVIRSSRRDGHRPHHVEGLDQGRWVLMDYIDYVVHVFHPEVRDFYRLEALWGDARRVEIADS